MTILLLVLSIARVATAAPASAPRPAPPRCERYFVADLIPVVQRMRTLRTMPTHQKNGVPTALLRLVLKHHLPDAFPEEARVLNQTELPKFEVKAERRLTEEGSWHAMLLLKLPNGPPAVLVHLEQINGEENVMTMPLGEEPLRELRDHLLEAYQLLGQFGEPLPNAEAMTPRREDLKHMWLFAEDRLRIDGTSRTGLSETEYEDVVQVLPAHAEQFDVWSLSIRRDALGFTLVRVRDDEDERLKIFAPGDGDAAKRFAVDELSRYLKSPGAIELDVYLDENETPSWTFDGEEDEDPLAPLIELLEGRLAKPQ